MSEYLLNNVTISPDSVDIQQLLEQAHKSGTRPLCCCMRPMPLMYIARVKDKFIIKRMPSSGSDHSPTCNSFMPPEELSGLSQLSGSAIDEDEEEGTTNLRIGFPLSIRGKSKKTPPTIGIATEAKTPERKLTLTSMLQYLWSEADLIKWYPAMENKRWWGIIHRELCLAADNKITKRVDLASRLYVPEPFNIENKNAIKQRRDNFFKNLNEVPGQGTALGVVIAEYKSHERTALGAKFTFKHVPDCSFFVEKDLADKFENVFEEQLQLAEMIEGAHVILISTFRMAPAGYPILQDIGMMLTTTNWIPFEHIRDAELINYLSEERRAFLKCMRFNLSLDTPIASIVTTDTRPPTAMFVAHPNSNSESDAQLIHTAKEGTYPGWVWSSDDAMPDLPSRNEEYTP
jgi:hypothetical protein